MQVLNDIEDEPFLIESEIDPDEQALFQTISDQENSNPQEESKEQPDATESERQDQDPETAMVVTPQTLGMYYYGLSKLVKKNKSFDDQVFQKICAILTKNENQIFDELEQVEDESYNFTTGL